MPNEVLGRIWNLADREQKGHLGLTEFIIAMHLLASYKSGAMRSLPQILPAGLYEAAARRGVPRQVTGSRPTSDSSPASAIPRQFSGAGYQGQTPPSRSTTMPFQQAALTGEQWAVSAQDKAQFDQIYATVDTQNRGFITGEQAVGFFSNSRLPEEALAQIWDLADINSEGQLNRDEFAVAMYLIRQQRSKKDGRDVLPQSLPSNLIPPSMRRQPIAPQQPTAPAFDNAANITGPKSASEDLFGLDALSSPSPPAAKNQPKTTNESSSVPIPSRTQTSPPPQQLPQQSSHFKPFVPSSSFGQAMMTPQSTGTASTSSPSVQNRSLPTQPRQGGAMDDLLGDNDPEVSNKLTNETSELANLSNQVSTLSGQMQEVKTQKGSTEQNLSQAQYQKRDFESRLAQLRSAYEQEVREVQALEERLKASRNETNKLQQDMAMIQGSHQDLQNQHMQVSEALNIDQIENANLKERIRQTNAEIIELKPQLEKMRSDARQQKGLVAINKKQLATNEQELEKIRAELAESAREHEEAKRDLEQSQRDIEATSKAVSEARSPPVDTPGPLTAVVSPVASGTSMNPFFRRPSNPTGIERAAASPFTPQSVSSPNHNAFDSFFGPSLNATAHEARPAPDMTFGDAGRGASSGLSGQKQIASQDSSEGPNVPTPSASPPPTNFSDSPQTASEPPAPPQSRQITSSFLPLRPNVERSGSESSSVKVVPPASRMGDRPGVGTSADGQSPMNETPIPESPKQHFEELAAKSPQADTRQLTPQSVQQTPSPSNGAISHQEAAVPDEDHSSGIPSSTREVPGAFPGDETPEHSLYRSTPYSSKLDPRVDSNPPSLAVNTAAESSTDHGRDPFAVASNGAHSPAAARDDFDSAFAGFDKGKAPEYNNGTLPQATKGRGEFPPIQELGGDDESDSDDDRGFDDEFTPQSANRTIESGPNQALQNPPISSNGGLAPLRPSFNTASSNASQLPTPGAQTSPPTYDQTFGSPNHEHSDRMGSNQFPAEYSGLLPSRDDPTSPTTSPSPPSSSNIPSNVGLAAGIDRGLSFFGGDNPEHAASHTTKKSIFPQDNSSTSGAPNTAPYAYTQSPPPAQQSQPFAPIVPTKTPTHDDFDDEFADLENAKDESDHGDTDFASSRHNDFDEFNPTFDSPAASRHTAQSSNTLPASDSFTDFNSSISGTGSSSRPLGASPSSTETPSHDWDAIFAGLDTPQNNGVQADPGPRNFSTSIGQSQATQAAQGEPKSAGKPALNRVLSEDNEHDDPILKRLTGMGYPRQESLQALEKFDYNLDKVGVSVLPIPS